MTHKTIFGIAILATMIAAPALAADMAVKAATGTPLATTWTGCYVNGGAGYCFLGRTNTNLRLAKTFRTRPLAVAGG